MNTIKITNANICIKESCHIIDTGDVEHVEIDIQDGIEVLYCYISSTTTNSKMKYTRHIKIGKESHFIGSGILMGESNIQIITEICGDHATSILDILSLATDQSNISVEGVAKVANPYRHVMTRVDQTNILIGKGSKVRGVPRLEIATDDIEGGHSCKIHRLGGDVLFYLTSRGLTHEHAEILLLNSEILRHLRTINPSERENICYDVHNRLKK